jgi:hypothetical protein
VELRLAKEIDSLLKIGLFPRGVVGNAISPISQNLVACVENNLRTFADRFRETIVAKTKRLVDPIGDELLPPNCRMQAGTEDYKCLVIEQSPQVRTILLTEGSPMRAAFPFIIFFPTFREGDFDHLNVAFTTKPLRSLSDKLCSTGLPNMGPAFDSQHTDDTNLPVFKHDSEWPFGICLGPEEYAHLIKECRGRSLTDQCEMIQNTFWSTEFDSSDLPRYFS